ncbi:hypothetical protein C8R41DRAFT_848610 [Lentinula lateritia]|uniref:Uncharacterized protein n=1 Tax=Lentinula lateritia TaxID=40482 RepID=A0ABQ8V586_9AGAR|nr:hypothetical protein C8R41DRAFT_848610 [Lentinula lateritia]
MSFWLFISSSMNPVSSAIVELRGALFPQKIPRFSSTTNIETEFEVWNVMLSEEQARSRCLCSIKVSRCSCKDGSSWGVSSTSEATRN